MSLRTLLAAFTVAGLCPIANAGDVRVVEAHASGVSIEQVFHFVLVVSTFCLLAWLTHQILNTKKW
jgi:hypothetical protein